MISDVRCPYCDHVLYQVQARSDVPTLLEYVKQPPAILSDESGTFIHCSRCGRKILMAMRQTIEGSGALLPIQSYGEDKEAMP